MAKKGNNQGTSASKNEVGKMVSIETQGTNASQLAQDTNASQLAQEVNASQLAQEMLEYELQAIPSRLAQALTIDKKDFYTPVKQKDGTSIEVIKKVYPFVTPQGKRNEIAMYDEELITATEKIKASLNGRTILSYVICKELSNINESGKLDKMGFSTIADFGKALFGLETSTVNHYARIGKNFLDSNYKVIGGLPDLSVSHFIELSKLVDEDGDVSRITELYQSGELVDGMSTKAVRKVVNDLFSSSNALEDKSDQEKTTTDSALGSTDSTSGSTDSPSGSIDSTSGSTDSNKTNTNEDSQLAGKPIDEIDDKQILVQKVLNYVDGIGEIIKKLEEKELDFSNFSKLDVCNALDTITDEIQKLL